MLGGSCTVALGLGAAVRTAGMTPRMGHALALDGAAPDLVAALGEEPLLDPGTLSYLGADTAEATDRERAELARPRAAGTPVMRR